MIARLQIAALIVIAGAISTPLAAEAESARAEPDFKFSRSSKAMGTSITITFWTEDEANAAKAATLVFSEFTRVDELMSSWLPKSDVARINAAAGARAVAVSEEVFNVIERAIDEAERTRGAFDITVGSFRGLWKFDQDIDGSIPSDADVKKRRRLVGYRGLALNKKKKTVKLKRKGSRVTLGGIAKGYAVDRAVAILHKLGFVDFILQAGGDLYVSGKKGSVPWIVGIRDPRGTGPFATAPVSNRTFSTSGDYERSLVVKGRRYHHILDPKSGYPADKCRSVTVQAKDAITADVWSTALFVLGPKEGMKLVERSVDLEAVFVSKDNKVTMSSGLKGKLQIRWQPTPGL